MEDNYNKWFGLTVVVVSLVFGLCCSVSMYYTRETLKQAMETGYQQQVIDDNVVWVKVDNSK